MKGKKKKSVTIKHRSSSGDLVSYQVSAIFHKLPPGSKSKDIPASLVKDFWRHKAETARGQWGRPGFYAGDDPPGVTLKVIWWQNPSRNGKAANRRYALDGPQGQAEAWGTLRRVISRI